MGNFCTGCGSELVDGVCPVCSANSQETYSQYNMYYEPNYNNASYMYQGYAQNMVCSVCGTQMVDGVCPNCVNQQMMYNIQQNDERYRRFFMSPKENLVTTLGNSYIQNFFSTGRIGNGFAVVSDKRVYFHGTAYNVFYDDKGRPKVSKTARSQTVDLKDITGTSFINVSNIGLKMGLIIYAIIYAIFFFVLLMSVGYSSSDKKEHRYTTEMSMTAIPVEEYIHENIDADKFSFLLFTGIAILIILAIKYFASRISLISIQYAGGEIAFNINWFPQEEISDFQRQLRLAKDRAIEESENAVANKFTQAMSNMNYNQSYVAQPSAADELMKYADLLQRGLITKEEFDNARRRLLND